MCIYICVMCLHTFLRDVIIPPLKLLSMPAEVCDWICKALACVNGAQSKWGSPMSASTFTVSKPIWVHWQKEHDCPSRWPHAQCQHSSTGMENIKKRSQDRGTRGARKGANGETKQGKWGDMLGWRMTRGSELSEYRLDRMEWWRSGGAAAMWRYTLGCLLVINMQRGVLNIATAKQCKQIKRANGKIYRGAIFNQSFGLYLK